MNLKLTRTNILMMSVISGTMALIVLGLILGLNGIVPFGNRSLLVGDMGAQYVPFLSFFKHTLATGQLTPFSFSIGVGENVVPLIAYYLLSPFNLITLPFPTSQLPVAITIVFMLKDAFIAATTSFFLAKHFNRLDWLNPVFALAFSLGGFITANFINIMWLDGLICLPLICYGIDCIKANHSSWPLFLWLTLCIMTNYYIGYMIGIFTIIYAIDVMISTHSQLPSGTKWLPANWPFIKSFAFTELCSVLTSLVVLLPTALGMLQTAKIVPSADNNLISVAKPQFGLEFLSQLGIGGQSYVNRLFHAPAIFASTAVVILAFTYFCHPRIPREHKTGAAVTLGILFFSMLIGPINLVWHMMSQPSGSPFRYSFLLSFMLIMIGYEALINQPAGIKTRYKLAIPTLITLLLIIGYGDTKLNHANAYLSLQPNSLHMLLINIILVMIYSAILFSTITNIKRLTVGALIVTELGANFMSTLATEPFASQSKYTAAYYQQRRELAGSTNPQTQLFRIGQQQTALAPAFKEIYYGYNDAQIFNYNGVQEYSSTLPEQMRETLKMLGLYSKNQRRIDFAGNTTISKLLLGVKYNLNQKGQIQPNSSYVGMGFPVSNQFANLKLRSGFIFTNLENILQTISPSSNSYLPKETINQSSRTITHSGTRYSLTVFPKLSGPLYFDTSDASFDYSSIKVNGKRLGNISDPLHKRYIIKLGTYRQGIPMTIQFLSHSQSALKKVNLITLNTQAFSRVVSQLKKHSFMPTYRNNQVSGSVTRTSPNQHWLYTSIPYDSGWTATVNRQPVKVVKVLGSFTAVPITSTTNHVVMRYHIPGLIVGCILSLLGLLLYLSQMIVKHFK
ncbi:YfhO family protein [Lentilactobacillus parabuchneri]|uniref:YfhO family protein n=1 Tax=Lentilactobacillus parabuchneri TaxID=152331 RepID=UPI003994D8B6